MPIEKEKLTPQQAVHKKLAEIQQTLSVPKDKKNEFGGYTYRNAEEILQAVKPLLKDPDYFYTVTFPADEIILAGDRYYLRSTARLSNGEGHVDASAQAREAEVKKGMDESQITGSSTSYARKYALGALFAIDDGRDADSMDNTTPERPKKVFAPTERKTINSPIANAWCAFHDIKMFQTPRMKVPAHLDEKRGWCNGHGYKDELEENQDPDWVKPKSNKSYSEEVADDIPM